MSIPDSSSTIRKTLLRALLMIGISLAGFAALVPVMLYVPENFLLRANSESKLDALMPAPAALPEDMIFVQESKFNNEDVAKNYSKPDEIEALLNGFGREEGYTQLYVSRARCKPSGIRSIYVGVVRMKDTAGAQAYQQWLRAKDFEKYSDHGPIEIDMDGYQLSSIADVQCPPYKEASIAIHFRRDQYLGTVNVYAVKGTVDDLERQALDLAQHLDETIRRNAVAP